MSPSEIQRNGQLVKGQIDRFIKEFASEFLSRLKRRTPVITGRLQAGWMADVTSDSVEVTNQEDYASFVEYGTHKMAPRGMLRATMSEAEQIATIAKERAGIKD